MLSLAHAFLFLNLFFHPTCELLYVISVVLSLLLRENCLPINGTCILRILALGKRVPLPNVFSAYLVLIHAQRFMDIVLIEILGVHISTSYMFWMLILMCMESLNLRNPLG